MNIYVDIGISFIDFLISITLFWAIYRGYKLGAIVHSVALLVLLAGIGLSGKISYAFFYFVQERARVTLYNLPVILFAIFSIFSIFAAHFITNKVIANVGATPKGSLNRFLGIAVNIVKYLYMISIISIILFKLDANFDLIHSKEKERTSLFYPILSIAPTTFRMLRFKELHPVPMSKPDVYENTDVPENLDEL